jgi:hypothetical protein
VAVGRIAALHVSHYIMWRQVKKNDGARLNRRAAKVLACFDVDNTWQIPIVRAFRRAASG